MTFTIEHAAAVRRLADQPSPRYGPGFSGTMVAAEQVQTFGRAVFGRNRIRVARDRDGALRITVGSAPGRGRSWTITSADLRAIVDGEKPAPWAKAA